MVYHIALIVAALLLGLCTDACTHRQDGQPGNADSSAHAAKDVYTCPMHPSVISDRPGACPVYPNATAICDRS